MPAAQEGLKGKNWTPRCSGLNSWFPPRVFGNISKLNPLNPLMLDIKTSINHIIHSCHFPFPEEHPPHFPPTVDDGDLIEGVPCFDPGEASCDRAEPRGRRCLPSAGPKMMRCLS